MELNKGNSIFQSLNDIGGLMICGYEWGFSKKDQKAAETEEQIFYDDDAVTTFPNKSAAHGERAFTWRYDNRIIKWFELWGHPLSRTGLGGEFEKSIIQTNWCNTQGHNINENYYRKLINPAQLQNFIHHVKVLQPSLIFFMGSEIINVLQNQTVMKEFTKIMGHPDSGPIKLQKPFLGRRFRIGFQKFEKCNIVSLPHPSSSRGLNDDYITLFSEDIGGLISDFKERRKIKDEARLV